jgi:hypothetical protein
MGQLNMELYLKVLKARYLRAGREGKTKILNEFCATSGYHRKHIVRLFTRTAVGWKTKPTGRPKEYNPEQLLAPLKKIWFATDQMCGKRLKVAIPLWLPYYDSFYEPLSEAAAAQLLQMSSATIDRLLKPVRVRFSRRLRGTKPGSLLKQHIPIKTDQWNEKQPGFVEGDTVAHCGTSLLGNFVWSITVTDIYSGWTENGAMWNKGSYGTCEQIRLIEDRLPFPLLGWDSDNGGEFLNYHLLKYFQERQSPVQFTRSRPYHSGDNAHVEQKNWTHVRQLFGYYRFNDQRLVSLMNDLYHNELSLLHNYFYPAMKLEDKIRIKSKIKKIHHKPCTPYQRLMESNHLSEERKAKLKQTFEELNPFQLRVIIEQKLKKIFSYVHKKPLQITGKYDTICS